VAVVAVQIRLWLNREGGSAAAHHLSYNSFLPGADIAWLLFVAATADADAAAVARCCCCCCRTMLLLVPLMLQSQLP